MSIEINKTQGERDISMNRETNETKGRIKREKPDKGRERQLGKRESNRTKGEREREIERERDH